MSLGGALGYAIMREIYDLTFAKSKRKQEYVELKTTTPKLPPLTRRSEVHVDPSYYYKAVKDLQQRCREEWPDEGYEDPHVITIALANWLEKLMEDRLEDICEYAFGPRPNGDFLAEMRKTKERLDRGVYGT